LGTLYFIYIGNVTGVIAAKDVNYGYAYSSAAQQSATANPQISISYEQLARQYFQGVANSPFDFDPVQFASKYAETAIGLASNPGPETADFVNQNLKDAISAEQDALSRVPNDPTAWQELANLYLTESIINKTPLDQKAIDAAQQAMQLAPGRPEPIVMMARLDIFQNNYQAAEDLINALVAKIPQDTDARFQLAVMYAYDGQMDKALAMGQEILADGYSPSQAGQIDWMGQAYDKKGDYAQAAGIYEIAVKVEPTNLQDQWALAQDYAKIGKKDQAIAIAQFLISQDSKDAQSFQDFINSLK